ncbi:MAG: TetR/AcrR family transcriptional regulator [Candidatus Binatus sp.]|jgi:AcrR family transcriptional regulator|uniref:TetR/AcrR family transcriptional regulator n=1 Tax=Candidatus Binatus sp. TaxID=2811406 RepID=UPI003C9A6950
MPKPLRKSKLKGARTKRTKRATGAISDTYDQILAVAEQEFANSGYNGASLEVIARRTGIRKASLFYHFNSKRKIFDAVVRRIFDQFVSIGRETAHIENPKEHLLAIIVRLHDFIASHPNHARLLMHRVLEDPASVRSSAELFIKPLVIAMAQLVIRGAEMGIIRNGDSPVGLTLVALAIPILPYSFAPVVEACTGLEVLSPDSIAGIRVEVLRRADLLLSP